MFVVIQLITKGGRSRQEEEETLSTASKNQIVGENSKGY
jgi:hypothetical protein